MLEKWNVSYESKSAGVITISNLLFCLVLAIQNWTTSHKRADLTGSPKQKEGTKKELFSQSLDFWMLWWIEQVFRTLDRNQEAFKPGYCSTVPFSLNPPEIVFPKEIFFIQKPNTPLFLHGLMLELFWGTGSSKFVALGMEVQAPSWT